MFRCPNRFESRHVGQQLRSTALDRNGEETLGQHRRVHLTTPERPEHLRERELDEGDVVPRHTART